jgi:hypothetical protein
MDVSAQDMSGKWYAKTNSKQGEAHYLLDIRHTQDAWFGYVDLPSVNLFIPVTK